MNSIHKRLSLISCCLLLMPDAAEGQVLDPLDTNVNDIDTSRPRLPAGLYDLKIDKVEKKRTKAGDADMLEIVLKTIENKKSTENEDIAPGFSLNHYIIVSEQPERPSKSDPTKTVRARTKQDIAADIALVAKSGGLNTTPKAVIDNPSILVGAICRTNLVIAKATAEFPESNRISSFVVRR